MSRLSILAGPLAIAAGLTLAACGGAERTAGVSEARDLASTCREVRRLSLTAQYDNFSFNFAEADRKFTQLISLYEGQDVETRCPDVTSKAFLLASQGLALSNQEQFRLAERAFDASEAALERATVVRPDDEVLLRNFRAQHELNKGDRQNVETLLAELQRSLAQTPPVGDTQLYSNELFTPDRTEVRRRVGEASAKYIRSISLSNDTGAVKASALDLSRALQEIEEAIDLIGSVPSASAAYRPRFLIQKAAIEAGLSDPERAAQIAAEAAAALQDLLPDTPLTARALVMSANTLSTLPRPESRSRALDVYASAFQIYEDNPVPIKAGSLWPFFSLALRERAEDPSRTRELNAAMFRAAQIVRSSVAAKTISEAAALFAQGDGAAADAVTAWQQASDRFSLLKVALVQSQNDPLITDEARRGLAQEVDAARIAADRALVARDRIAPGYRSAVGSPISLDAVQAALKPGEALVQIVAGSPRNVVFIVEPDRVDVFTEPGSNAEVAADAVAAIRASVETAGGDGLAPFPVQTAANLYRTLFGARVARMAEFDRVVFALNGALASLPMELLVTDIPAQSGPAAWAENDYSGVGWLGDLIEISYVPSPRNLVEVRAQSRRSQAEKPVLSFGDFTGRPAPGRLLEQYGLDDRCRDLAQVVATIPALPKTKIEVETVASNFGTPQAFRTGDGMTEAAINRLNASGELKDYRILHFATHGLLWQSPDCFSEPALMMSVTPDSPDPFLTTTDIRGLDLDAQLVILSACQTAGPLERGALGAAGDSLSGLARAFIAAGTRSLMASHWDVPDETTLVLMVATAETIAEGGVGASTALRDAQAKIRAIPVFSHPVFWAGFVVIGDGALQLEGVDAT